MSAENIPARRELIRRWRLERGVRGLWVAFGMLGGVFGLLILVVVAVPASLAFLAVVVGVAAVGVLAAVAFVFLRAGSMPTDAASDEAGGSGVGTAG